MFLVVLIRFIHALIYRLSVANSGCTDMSMTIGMEDMRIIPIIQVSMIQVRGENENKAHSY